MTTNDISSTVKKQHVRQFNYKSKLFQVLLITREIETSVLIFVRLKSFIPLLIVLPSLYYGVHLYWSNLFTEELIYFLTQ